MRTNKIIQDCCSKKKIDQTLSAYIGKLYKDIAGRGPENVHVAFGETCYVVYIKNYVMPYERLIQQSGDMDLLHKVMQVTTRCLNAQIVKYTDFITGITTEEMYYDLNIETGSRVLIGIGSRQYDVRTTDRIDYYGEKQLQLLNKEIIRLGHFTDSIPETLTSFCLNSKFFVFVKGGGITSVEKEMEMSGYGDVIKNTKRQVEKRYLNNNLFIKNVIDMGTVDTFMDWNFKKNKSIVILVKSPDGKMNMT